MKKNKLLLPNRKQQVLDFVESLESKEAKPESGKEFPVRSKRKGIIQDLNYDKTSELL